MKRPVCLASALAVLALSAVASVQGQGQETPTIKQIMAKLHKGANAPLAKAKAALKGDAPDWKAVQDASKDMVILGALLSKNDPPRGEKADFDKLANTYHENAKALDDAAKAEDKAKSQAALGKIGGLCKSCHSAHKGQ
jgi:cytochrome c556